MFFFCKPSAISITFFTANQAVYTYSRPQNAAAFIPDWFKNLPKQEIDSGSLAPRKTIRACPAITTLYSSGFMLPLWSDLNLEAGSDYYRYQFADKVSTIEPHGDWQTAGSPFSTTHLSLKLVSPWIAKASARLNAAYTAPVWNGFGVDEFCVSPGVFDISRMAMKTNVNFFVKKHDTPSVYQLKFGQPLAHVLPLTDKRVKLNYELVTEQEFNRLLVNRPLYFFFGDRYHRSSKLCPHAK
jgi:hypothetical protein